MMAKKIFLLMVLGFFAFSPMVQGAEKGYPRKPIQMVIPFAAGGDTDIVGRAIARVAPKYLGQPFAVVNFTGGSGTVGTASRQSQTGWIHRSPGGHRTPRLSAPLERRTLQDPG